MTKRRLLVAAVLLGVAVAAYVLLLSPSDEQRIRYQLTRLTTTLTVRPDTDKNPIAHLAYVNNEFAEIFDEGVRVHIAEVTSLSQGRTELAKVAAEMPMHFRAVSVSLDGEDVKIDAAKRNAQIDAMATVRATQNDGRDVSDKRAVTFQAVKRDGSWRISSVNVWDKQDVSEGAAPP